MPAARPRHAPSRLFPDNRRDGARLLSMGIVITGAALLRFDHPAGRAIALVFGVLSLIGWGCYRRLSH
ncbi:hypothetical protein NZK33_20375 [Cyanobium sp. FGCU-6]|nr:hypothetical protein [Cyanobium sp. FGCU6]